MEQFCSIKHTSMGRSLLCFFCTLSWMSGGCTSPDDALSGPAGAPPEPMHAKPLEEKDNSPPDETRLTTNGSTRIEKRPQASSRDSDDASGGVIADIILTPLRTYAKVKTNLNEIQITHQMNNFRANNRGKSPKDFIQYKKEILDPLGITLPELPNGDSYVFDPNRGKTGELLVRTKKQ